VNPRSSKATDLLDRVRRLAAEHEQTVHVHRIPRAGRTLPPRRDRSRPRCAKRSRAWGSQTCTRTRPRQSIGSARARMSSSSRDCQRQDALLQHPGS